MGKEEEENGGVEGEVESFDESEEMDDLLVTFEDDDGNEVDFMVLAVMDIGGQDYAMLAPVEQLGDDESEEGVELYYFKYTESDDGEESYDAIEDEALLETVHQAFAELMEQQDEGEE